MARKHFIAKKVGGRYELMEESPQETAACTGWAVGGGLLALMGLSRRSIPGALMAAVGGAMVYRGVTGRDPMRFVRELINWEPPGSVSETPSYQYDFKGRSTQRPQDEVDEASMESFPASDPPASMSAQLPK